MKNGTQGFTLIELLIVIAIIGILAAVLIPNLIGARARGFDTAAMGCARAIGLAAEDYRIDQTADVGFEGFDMEYVNTFDPKSCSAESLGDADNASVTVTDADSFEGEAFHTNGKRTYTITQDGMSNEATDTTPVSQ